MLTSIRVRHGHDTHSEVFMLSRSACVFVEKKGGRDLEANPVHLKSSDRRTDLQCLEFLKTCSFICIK